MAVRKQLSDTLKEISAAAKERRWKSVKRDGGGGDMDVEESVYGAGSNGYQGAGTETVDVQVGK